MAEDRQRAPQSATRLGCDSSVFPLHDPDVRPGPGRRRDLELADQPLGAAQPQPEAVRGGEAVAHGHRDLGDARPLVVEVDLKADAAVAADLEDRHLAAAAMHEGVAGQLADGGDELGSLQGAEAERDDAILDGLPRCGHLIRSRDPHPDRGQRVDTGSPSHPAVMESLRPCRTFNASHAAISCRAHERDGQAGRIRTSTMSRPSPRDRRDLRQHAANEGVDDSSAEMSMSTPARARLGEPLRQVVMERHASSSCSSTGS